MKYLLPFTLLAAAALGAIRESPHVGAALPLADGSTPTKQGDPPWLAEDWSSRAAILAAGEADDPHAGLYASVDPHAGLYGSDDPHAGPYDSGDAHTTSGATLDDAISACPVEGVTMAGVGGVLDRLDADPHMAPLGRAGLLQAGLEPRVVMPSGAANGHTIATIHARRTDLAEHMIRVRGTVIRRTDGILGKSYLHLWDGSAAPETHADDLTVTTTDEFQIGETVEVEGRLLVDQDVGLGYRYTALLDGATRVAAN
jgi:hypothetical protein